ncbi:MAG: phosphoribosyl transferase [Chloroflexi bacterium]|nr:phosphoribosyl transferase [Chloroflexota bacterium]
MPSPIFRNRSDAGAQLAARLGDYIGHSVVVLAIPNGGVPVAAEIANSLNADFDVVISRKIPMPLHPESSFGAIADDGTMLLDEKLARMTHLDEEHIQAEAVRVRDEVRRRSLLYRGNRPCISIHNKVAIVVDDGLASGITMMAAINSVRQRRPMEIVAAVPCASMYAKEQVEKAADKVIICALGTGTAFTVSDYYHYWSDVEDSDVVRTIEEFQTRRFYAAHNPPAPELWRPRGY